MICPQLRRNHYFTDHLYCIMPVFNHLFYRFLYIIIGMLPSAAGQSQGISAIDQRIESLIQREKIPGGVALIMQNGKMVHHRAYGRRSATESSVMRTDNIFRIASMTKAIVSVGLLQLIEEHRIPLDTPLHAYLPGFRNEQVAIRNADGSFNTRPADRAVTLRDILTHRSGISAASEHPGFLPLYRKFRLDDAMHLGFRDLEELCDSLAAMPLVHDPGARFSYGASTDVAGRLIELISGMRMDRYLEVNVFKPLRMRDTRFRLSGSQAERLVPVSVTLPEGKLGTLDARHPLSTYPLDADRTFFSAAGGLVSTAQDYARFLECLRLGGRWKGKRLLGEAWVDSLLTDQLGGDTFIFGGIRGLNGFGLGVGITSKAGQNLTHATPGSFFWGGALNASYLVDRTRGIITVFLFQRTPFDLAAELSTLERMAIDALDPPTKN